MTLMLRLDNLLDSTIDGKDHVATWLFGRGCSIACGLTWAEPSWWRFFPRRLEVALIKRRILVGMEQIPRGIGPYRNLLALLKTNTRPEWNHQFCTTNWDYLLQREISDLSLSVKPNWLFSSHVYHLNGSVENWGEPRRRNEILLESDPADYRSWSLEASKAFNVLIHQRIVIVAGVSFRCKTDSKFLDALGAVHDELPIGEATWIVINSDPGELDAVKGLLITKIPNSRVIPVHQGFDEWVSDGCMHLKEQGVIRSPAACRHTSVK